eukprot:GHVU01030476.1.p1 GENE.GHVU01030476.1~~GHVU01030476.1.p1  ORF type:complete len:193 (+),score=17.63 GHVU01030476.1:31-579(+)
MEKTYLDQQQQLQTLSHLADNQNSQIADLLAEMDAHQLHHVSNNKNVDMKHSGTLHGFFATLSGSTYGGVPLGSVIPFDTVRYNTGSYNPSTGTFTCPVTGEYVLSYCVHIPSGDNGALDLHIGSSAFTTSYAKTQNSAVSHVYFNLNQGDAVTVRYRTGTRSIYGGHYTHFSGYLLKAAEQ